MCESEKSTSVSFRADAKKTIFTYFMPVSHFCTPYPILISLSADIIMECMC